MEIRAWPEARARVPAMGAVDREALRRLIEADGVLHRITVMADGRIIDGHNRWEIAGGDCDADVRDVGEEEGLRLAVVLKPLPAAHDRRPEDGDAAVLPIAS